MPVAASATTTVFVVERPALLQPSRAPERLIVLGVKLLGTPSAAPAAPSVVPAAPSAAKGSSTAQQAFKRGPAALTGWVQRKAPTSPYPVPAGNR
ncbi:hypothetical protein ACIP4Y_35270 [Streptomyces sp. NPDC088810]|uniref:hypothetical protein n=1 Tax=Streptomyces sp. NPDC088810 TaxID=3365904 RepID=UPI0038141033